MRFLRFFKTKFICCTLVFLLPHLSWAGSHSLSSSEIISIEELERFIEQNRKLVQKAPEAVNEINKPEKKTTQISPTGSNSQKAEKKVELSSQGESLTTQNNETTFGSKSKALYLSTFVQMAQTEVIDANGFGIAFGLRDYSPFFTDPEKAESVFGYDVGFSYSQPAIEHESGGDRDAELYEIDAEIYVPLLTNFYSGLGYKFQYLKNGPGQYSNGTISNSSYASLFHLPIGYNFKLSDSSLLRFQYNRIFFGTGKIYLTERPFDYWSDASVNLNDGFGFKLAYVNPKRDWELYASYFEIDESNSATVPYGPSNTLRSWKISKHEKLKLGLKFMY